MSVRIYVEGGFQGKTKAACRQGFRLFLEKIVRPGSFRVIACGSRAEAFDYFRLALSSYPGDFVILLVDSEGAVTGSRWNHLRTRVGDGWHQPAGTTEDQVHLMVQVMESWFLADRDSLTAYYGQGFSVASLPGQPNIELIPKNDVFRALASASRHTTKGEYHKTKHAFDLLERLDPTSVRTASTHAARFFTVLTSQTV